MLERDDRGRERKMIKSYSHWWQSRGNSSGESIPWQGFCLIWPSVRTILFLLTKPQWDLSRSGVKGREMLATLVHILKWRELQPAYQCLDKLGLKWSVADLVIPRNKLTNIGSIGSRPCDKPCHEWWRQTLYPEVTSPALIPWDTTLMISWAPTHSYPSYF